MTSRRTGGFFVAAMSDDGRDDDPLTAQPIFDPQSIPHDPAFVDASVRGSAVDADRLHPAALRQRFVAPPIWSPELRTDVRLFYPDRPPRTASVLIPLIARGDGVYVLLTERTAHLHDHAGQISFPGGGVDPGDADAAATALREAFEEIGLPPSHVQGLGALPEYLTASGYIVTPVVGLIEQPFTVKLDPFEVSEVFEVPLEFLMDPVNHQRRIFQLGNTARTFYAMPYKHITDAEGRMHFIWGATAAMLRNLYHFLRADQ
jgi:8-oxo-dGTP pyrophosphatase MutT (NUDIX family)